MILIENQTMKYRNLYVGVCVEIKKTKKREREENLCDVYYYKVNHTRDMYVGP